MNRTLLACSFFASTAIVVFASQGCSSKTMLTASCSDTEMDCDGTCVDLRSSSQNCGACGKACKQGETCSSGICGCGSPKTSCTGSCVDTSTDPKNCGTCGKACGAGETCASGACGNGAGCGMGQTKCGSTCTSTMTDRANCGTCGKACNAMELCTNGACVPCGDAGTQTVCSGDGGAYCADLQTDNANCGMCGMGCTGSDTCVNGMCKPMCSPNWLSSMTNWTQNNSTYASEILNSSYNATNLFDNVITTRWVTASTTNQWVIVNFGSTVTLSKIQVLNQANYTANAGGKDTVLQRGPGLNGPWTDVTSFQVANQQNNFQQFSFNQTASQYWRIYVKNNWGYQSYIQFMEVGFYGCP